MEFRQLLHRMGSWGIHTGSLLELGCAYGFFLTEASTSFRCIGLEISATAVDICRSRGLDVYQGELTEEFICEKGAFDVVVMLDVVEHLQDPGHSLLLISSGLKQGGSVVISTGDWGSLTARVLGSQWRLMTPPQHLHFLTTGSLEKMLNRAGLKVVRVAHPWKHVPLGLMLHQIGRRLMPHLASMGWFKMAINRLSTVGVPVNLFDAMQILAVKE